MIITKTRNVGEMKKRIIMIVLITISFSCKDQRQDINQQFVVSIVKEEIDSQIILFLKSNDKDQIGYTTISILQKTYGADSRFKTKDKHNFISKTLSQEIAFNCGDIVQCFILNDTIKDFYANNSFSAFLKNYCVLNISQEYIIRENLSFNAELSVIYFLYQNEFYTTQDDVSGYYSTRSLKTLYKQIDESNKETLLLEKQLNLSH